MDGEKNKLNIACQDNSVQAARLVTARANDKVFQRLRGTANPSNCHLIPLFTEPSSFSFDTWLKQLQQPGYCSVEEVEEKS